MQSNIWNKVAIIAVVALGLLLPRMVALDRFVTIDEPDWVRYSANFYYAITHKDFLNTYQSYHPGVPTAWIGAAAFFLKLPQYRGWGQGYFDNTANFLSFLSKRGIGLLDLLTFCRQLTIMAQVAVLLGIFLLIWRLIGLRYALLCTGIVAADPYFLGHSRLFTQEGLFSGLFLLSLLAYFLYITKEDKFIFLAMSGISAGFACLTKSPGIILILLIMIITVVHEVQRYQIEAGLNAGVRWGRYLKRTFLKLFIWGLLVACVYFGVWPSMWVNPAGSLTKVYSTAWTFIERGDVTVLSRVGGSEGFRFELYYYLLSLLWRSSPVVWLGVTFAICGILLFHPKKGKRSMVTWMATLLLAVSVVYLSLIAIGGAKRAGHYIMTTHLGFDIVAGLGYMMMGERLWDKARAKSQRISIYLMCTILLMAQLVGIVQYYPYYFNYFNPLLGGSPVGARMVGVGYGEVLDQAARYLAREPEAKKLVVMSWYGLVSFAPFFPGETVPLFPRSSWDKRDIERLKRSDYLVIYYQHQINRNLPPTLLAGIKDLSPEYSIIVNGVEYVRIYNVKKLPPEVFEPDQGIAK